MDARFGGLAYRHPFEIRAVGSSLARRPVPFAPLGIVIRGAVRPRVVGDLVVVPDDDERVLTMGLLEIWVGAIGGVTDSVVAQRDCFSPRLRDSEEPAAFAVHAVLELVDVVADVDDSVEVRTVGDTAVDIEEA